MPIFASDGSETSSHTHTIEADMKKIIQPYAHDWAAFI
jgi:hypothetical protein